MDYLNLIIVVFLIALSGLFSGLTLGLLGLDKVDVERKAKLGDKKAKKVYSVRKNGNLLLCTLLIGNTAVNSAIAIFLGSLASGLIAGIVSTGLIVIFGEIIPQAVSSRHALEIGARSVWLVKIFIFVLYPVCYPISKVLDKALGEEMGTIYSKKELQELIKYHEEDPHSKIDLDEERILLGALSYSDKTAKKIMTPLSVVFMLEEKTSLDDKILSKIKESGFTRIPVYKKQKQNVVGILNVKELLLAKKGSILKDYAKKSQFLKIREKTKLDTLLNKFIKKRIHIALIYNEYNVLQGLVSLEDIVEEIFKREIVDENDRVVNLQKIAKQKAKKRFSKK